MPQMVMALRQSELSAPWMATWPALRLLKLAGIICFSLYLSHAVIVRTISTRLYRAGLTDPTVTVLTGPSPSGTTSAQPARPILQAEGTVR